MRSYRRGQAMLIAVLSLGGAMLAATTIAGLLILYQLRASTDSAHSSQAIFAADTGVDWALYDYYCGSEGNGRSTTDCPPATLTTSTLSNGAVALVTCYDALNEKTLCNDTSTHPVSYVVSKGTSLNTSRAFYLLMMGATSTGL